MLYSLPVIRSMTGYGIAEKHTPEYEVKVEIRSLNAKFLDLNFRIPRYLQSKEIIFRNLLGSKIERGSCVISVYVVKHTANANEIKINKALATEYYRQLKELSISLDSKDDDIFRITTMMQDVIYQDDQEVEAALITLVKQTLEAAFVKFDEFRIKEGATIKTDIEQSAKAIMDQLPAIEQLEPERIEITRERLHKNMLTLLEDESYDRNRFEQELIYYIEKFDISEEKSRLLSHCNHFFEALEKEPKGKKLSFIAQEMGREINTLGSKANHSSIQRYVINMKEELERIKEQVLNIL